MGTDFDDLRSKLVARTGGRVAYGTSLTQTWPLAGPWCMRYLGIPNGDVRYGLHRCDDLVLPQQPSALFLEFSMNDCREMAVIGPTEAADMACEIARRAIDAGCRKVFLMTMNGYCVGLPALARARQQQVMSRRHRIEPYYEAYRQAAAARGLGLIDVRRAWDALDPVEVARLIPDGVHPTMDGHQKVLAPLVSAAIAAVEADYGTVNSPAA